MPHLISSLCTILLTLLCLGPGSLMAAESPAPESPDTESSKEEKPSWDIENPPWTTVSQPINATEGTWISLDVSPDGQHIVFDFLGDLYHVARSL